MTENIFWELIEASNSLQGGNAQTQEEFLVDRLSKLSNDDIVKFEMILRKFIIRADDFVVMAIAKIVEGYVSDDSFLYFRCWVISRGKEFYELAFSNLDLIAERIESDTETYFEELMYVADRAFEKSNQVVDEEVLPRSVAFSEGLDYDWGSKTTGKDWREDDLPLLYPKLWAKFNG